MRMKEKACARVLSVGPNPVFRFLRLLCQLPTLPVAPCRSTSCTFVGMSGDARRGRRNKKNEADHAAPGIMVDLASIRKYIVGVVRGSKRQSTMHPVGHGVDGALDSCLADHPGH